MDLILGSQSPRRREILQFFSLPFRQIASDYDESLVPFTGDPVAYAQEIARQKALCLSKIHPAATILTADTVVFLDGKSFGKPTDLQEAHAMLRALSGREHQVFTAVCAARGNRLISGVEESRVTLNELTDAQIHIYLNRLHPLDKAGGFAVQGGGSLIVKRIEGCYYNVMGLPPQTVRRLLLEMGIDLWDYLKAEP